jgi:hypothetical protein
VGAVLRVEETRFWPLVPGGVLAGVGFIVLAGSEGARALEIVGPLLLVGLGVVVILVALRSRGAGPGGPPGGTQPPG